MDLPIMVSISRTPKAKALKRRLAAWAIGLETKGQKYIIKRCSLTLRKACPTGSRKVKWFMTNCLQEMLATPYRIEHEDD